MKLTTEEVLNHWQIQENLLQTYRVLFVTSQTLVFSVASITVSQNKPDKITFFVLLCLGLYLLTLWYKICRSRGFDVSYCQKILLDIENNIEHETFMTNFKKWQKKKRDEKVQILSQYETLPESPTRRNMEFKLPFIFALLWLILSLKVLGVLDIWIMVIK